MVQKMKYKKVLLITPTYSGSRVRRVLSAGLGYIAQTLQDNSIQYDILDMSIGHNYKILHKKINGFQPDLIGIGMMTYKYKETYETLNNCRKNFPDIDIVAGGPHISLFREQVLEDCPSISFGIVLEGEKTIIELCQGKNPSEIKGLIYRNSKNIIYTGDKEFIENLDSISFPRYEKFNLDKLINKETSALPIVSSRGCPFQCIYCPVNLAIGHKFRVRSPENIVAELKYWYSYGYRRFSFADDNFTLLKDRVYKICDLINQSPMKDLKLSCDNGIRADKVDRDLLKTMKETGFWRIAIGVEAGNDKILKILKKQEKIEQIKEVIKDACDLGFEVDLFFLVGAPGETLSDLQDSFKIVEDFPIASAYFYNIIPFPKTQLYEWIEKNGRFLKKSQDYLNENPILDMIPVFETPQMSKKERQKALKDASKIMRKTMRKIWQKRMKKYGFAGEIASNMYTTSFVQNKLLRIKTFKNLISKIVRIFF